jgi:hypothetical protein
MGQAKQRGASAASKSQPLHPGAGLSQLALPCAHHGPPVQPGPSSSRMSRTVVAELRSPYRDVSNHSVQFKPATDSVQAKRCQGCAAVRLAGEIRPGSSNRRSPVRNMHSACRTHPGPVDDSAVSGTPCTQRHRTKQAFKVLSKQPVYEQPPGVCRVFSPVRIR